jgi:hypothetical protein
MLVIIQLKYIIPFAFQNAEHQDIQNNTFFHLTYIGENRVSYFEVKNYYKRLKINAQENIWT